MKTIYFNFRGSYGVETVDQICKDDFTDSKEYKKELRNMLSGYHEAGMNVYLSQRCTKDWKESK
jgi:hypothetical protein